MARWTTMAAGIFGAIVGVGLIVVGAEKVPATPGRAATARPPVRVGPSGVVWSF